MGVTTLERLQEKQRAAAFAALVAADQLDGGTLGIAFMDDLSSADLAVMAVYLARAYVHEVGVDLKLRAHHLGADVPDPIVRQAIVGVLSARSEALAQQVEALKQEDRVLSVLASDLEEQEPLEQEAARDR